MIIRYLDPKGQAAKADPAAAVAVKRPAPVYLLAGLRETLLNPKP